MPRKRRRLIQRNADLGPELRKYLETGERPKVSEAELEGWEIWQRGYLPTTLWERHGGTILAEWVVERPGTRPRGWWKCEAPEPRRLVRGELPAVQYLKWPETYSFGAAGYIGIGEPPRWESERAYLRRHRLLLRGEAEALKGQC